MEPYGTFWNPMEPYGTIWNPMEPYGTLWNPREPYGTLWNPIEPYETLVNPIPPQNTTSSKNHPVVRVASHQTVIKTITVRNALTKNTLRGQSFGISSERSGNDVRIAQITFAQRSTGHERTVTSANGSGGVGSLFVGFEHLIF